MNLNDLFTDRNSSLSRLIRCKARQVVRHAGFSRSDLSDVEQELALEVFQEHERYDPARAEEATYQARVVKSKAISLIRARESAGRNVSHEAGSLNESIRDADGSSVKFAQTLDTDASRRHTGHSHRSDQEQTELQLDMEELRRSLPNDLRQLAELLENMTEFAASNHLARSRRDVAKDVARLRELLVRFKFREYL